MFARQSCCDNPASKYLLCSPLTLPMSQRPHSARRPGTATTREQTRVQVGVRVRPLNRCDQDDPRIVVSVADPPQQHHHHSTGADDSSSVGATAVTVDSLGKRAGGPKVYNFDAAFHGGDQEEVFDRFGRSMLNEAYKGFNVCLFAYGQTGSGKTYSLMGDESGPGLGLVPRFVHELFRIAQQKCEDDSSLTVKITVSFLEVYMERIHDLFVTRVKGQDPESLDIHETSHKKVYVKGLSVHSVLSPQRVMELLSIGVANRQTAETRMNDVSSRSHSIVQFTVMQIYDQTAVVGANHPSSSSPVATSPSTASSPASTSTLERRDLESTISLVDLAGSERQGKTDLLGDRFDESRTINKSLLMLGRALNSFSGGGGLTGGNKFQPQQSDAAGASGSGAFGASQSMLHANSTGGFAGSGLFAAASSSSLLQDRDSAACSTVAGPTSSTNSSASATYVPLRESKLTRLLSDCFGGNSKTWMLATVSPAACHLSETLSTLDYATNAKSITNRATVNKVARKLEIAGMKAKHAELERVVAKERETVVALEQQTLRLETENSALHGLLAKQLASTQSSVLDRLILQQLETNEKLKSYVEFLRSARERSKAAADDRHSARMGHPAGATEDASSTLAGRVISTCGASLDNVFLLYRKAFQVRCEDGVVMKFELIPMTHAANSSSTGTALSHHGDSSTSAAAGAELSLCTATQAPTPLTTSATASSSTHRTVWDAIGHDVNWVVVVVGAANLPRRLVGRHVFFRVSLRMDTRTSFDTTPYEVKADGEVNTAHPRGGPSAAAASGTAASVSAASGYWQRRFKLHRITKAWLRHCAESPVVTIDVVECDSA